MLATVGKWKHYGLTCIFGATGPRQYFTGCAVAQRARTQNLVKLQALRLAKPLPFAMENRHCLVTTGDVRRPRRFQR
jgi:hypothetical protein